MESMLEIYIYEREKVYLTPSTISGCLLHPLTYKLGILPLKLLKTV